MNIQKLFTRKKDMFITFKYKDRYYLTDGIVCIGDDNPFKYKNVKEWTEVDIKNREHIIESLTQDHELWNGTDSFTEDIDGYKVQYFYELINGRKYKIVQSFNIELYNYIYEHFMITNDKVIINPEILNAPLQIFNSAKQLMCALMPTNQFKQVIEKQ